MNQMSFLSASKIEVISKNPKMIMFVKGVIVPYAYKCLMHLDVLLKERFGLTLGLCAQRKRSQ